MTKSERSEHNERVIERLKREAMAGPHGYHECPDTERCRQHRNNVVHDCGGADVCWC